MLGLERFLFFSFLYFWWERFKSSVLFLSRICGNECAVAFFNFGEKKSVMFCWFNLELLYLRGNLSYFNFQVFCNFYSKCLGILIYSYNLSKMRAYSVWSLNTILPRLSDPWTITAHAQNGRFLYGKTWKIVW